jgi:Mrp family chromosome partitioning ATPase
MVADARGRDAEAYRVLRSNVENRTLGHEVRSLMVTSDVDGDGKSTTIANLAVALAGAGDRVALVDLDLRTPRIHKFFNLANERGVAQVAHGELALEDALRPIWREEAVGELRVRVSPAWIRAGSDLTGVEPASTTAWQAEGPNNGRLDVLVAGPIPPDPGEFVASKSLVRVIETLMSWYDVVLIDAPPLLHVAGAIALASKVDAMIVVVDIDSARRATLAELRQTIQGTRALKLGLVVTGAKRARVYGDVWPADPKQEPVVS